MASPEREVLVAYPTRSKRPEPVKRYRSTLLCSGIAVFRERGLFDRYAAQLDPETRDTLVNAVAGVWLPASVATSHFAAVDTLGLTADEAFEIGEASGKRIQGSVLHALIHMAAGTVATPWTVLNAYERLWVRVFDGGGFTIVKAGPKEAILELHGLPVARFAYFRNAFRGANSVGLRMFASMVYVREVKRTRASDGLTLRIAWV
jgi:hypothetical protein